MRKYVLSILFLMMAATVMGQKKSIVNLIQSQRSKLAKINGRDVIKVYKGTFKQDYSLLSSDSAYFYSQDNAFDAFGNVNINQGDTLNIFSDKLNYNGNTKVAILTDNVKMIDKDATLTTNYLTYNTATRIGTYTNGGKLVNKDNVLTSKNGYYFAYSRDSYFRYDVVLTTVDALIKTDTLRYNTGSRIAYFYGPTNIYGTKDKDTLYTENGLYNTVTEQAFFGKKNSYKQGTKSLKGDSLFYDRIKGFGRAVKNITFNDNEQKITLKGDLATYYKADEKTIVTQNAYVVLVTEDKDSTKTDSVAKPRPDDGNKLRLQTAKEKNTKVNNTKTNNKDGQITNLANVAEGINPGIAKNIPPNTIPVNKPFAITRQDSARADSSIKAVAGMIKDNPSIIKNIPIGKNDSANVSTAAALINAGAVNLPDVPKLSPSAGNSKTVVKNKPAAKPPVATSPVTESKAPQKVKRDSIFMSADTIETQILTYKNLKAYQEKQRRSYQRDTSAKARKITIAVTESKVLTVVRPAFPADTSYWHRNIFRKIRSAADDSVQRKKDKLLVARKAKRDSIARVATQKDPVYQIRYTEPQDTARIRILIAHHHSKMFKSDLQAKSDSIFYSSSDSTIRMYVKPMIWAEGSQLSGDTINLQMKNKKIDNLEMYASAFIVNIEPGDSVHFNQMGGKKMRGFFRDNKLITMISAGNAESIYFQRDSGKVSNMQRSLSSRIIVNFKDNKIQRINFATKPDIRYLPIHKVKEDEKILTGFIWKPKDRPVSKEDVIHQRRKKATEVKPAAKKPPAAKPGTGVKPLNNPLKTDSLKGSPIKNLRDTVLKPDSAKLQNINLKKDTLSKPATANPQPLRTNKDSVVNKMSPVKKN